MKYDGLNIVKAELTKMPALDSSKKSNWFYIVLYQIIICIFAINVFGLLGKIDAPFFNNLNAIFSASSSVYPGDTFTKEEKIKFVSQFFFGDALYVSGNTSLEFILPVQSDSVSVVGGVVKISMQNFDIVRAAEDGIVSKVGKAGDVKFVEIKHTNSITTRYVGLDYLGVNKNYIAQKSAPIGSIRGGITLEFSIIYKGKVIASTNIENGVLVW